MRRFCFLLKVRRDRLEQYRAAHERVWPEMLDALRETGRQAEMAPFFEDLDGAAPDTEMRPLAEIFHLD